MKLLRTVSILAAAIVAAATPFFQDDTVVAGVDVAARGSVLTRDISKQCGPSGACYAFMKRCNFLDCKKFTIECDNWCKHRLCLIGPDVCREGGECASEYHCDGSHGALEGFTKASASVHNVEPVAALASRDIEESTHGVTQTDQENSSKDECPKCDDWLNECKTADCDKPSSPACRDRCHASLCALGPAMCRKAGTCGLYTGCSVGERPPVPTVSARSEPESDKTAGCPQCNDYLKECKATNCDNPSSPACRDRCQASLCAFGPATCRKTGSCGRYTGCGLSQEHPPVPKGSDARVQVDNLEVSARSEPESDQTAGCPQCNDWIKHCKKAQCPLPWAPNCQWDCQRRLCKDGPKECRRGGSCSQCGKAVTDRAVHNVFVNSQDPRSSNDNFEPSNPVNLQGEPEDYSQWVEFCNSYCGTVYGRTRPNCDQICRGGVCKSMPMLRKTPFCEHTMANAEAATFDQDLGDMMASVMDGEPTTLRSVGKAATSTVVAR